jgi:hypothetical protein
MSCLRLMFAALAASPILAQTTPFFCGPSDASQSLVRFDGSWLCIIVGNQFIPFNVNVDQYSSIVLTGCTYIATVWVAILAYAVSIN